MKYIDEQLTRLFEQDRVAIRAILCEYEDDYDVIDELAQETFLRAWQDRDKFSSNSRLLTWVCGIAKNVARDYVKSKRGQPDLVPEDVLRVPHSDGYTDTLVAAVPEDDPAALYEAQDLINAVVASMPPLMREVILLRMEGNTNPEIAVILSTSLSSVENAVSSSNKYFK